MQLGGARRYRQTSKEIDLLIHNWPRPVGRYFVFGSTKTPPRQRIRSAEPFESNLKQRRTDRIVQVGNVIVHRDPEIMSGEPVFVGTRVPLKALFDHLEAGDPLEVFLKSFPSVTREQAIAALRIAKKPVENINP